MTVDLSKLEVGDTIELRDGNRHEVTGLESGPGLWRVSTEEARDYGWSYESRTNHYVDGRISQYDTYPGDIVAIHPAPRIARPDVVSTMRGERTQAIAGVPVRPSPAALPLSTALYELHDVVLRTHSTLVNGPLEADRERMRMSSALGLASEAGEFVDLVKKTYEQGRVFDRDKAIKELGDIFYYLQLATMALDTTLPEVVGVLRDKLAARYPDGFSTAASAGRKEE